MTQGSGKEMTEQQQVTIYTDSELFGNIVKREGKLIKYGVQKYAQYDKAPFVHYIPKGKRKAIGFFKTYKPFLLILPGLGHPDPDNMTDVIQSNENVTISKSRYKSFDTRYKSDFNPVIDAYCIANKITPIFDVRH